MNQKVQKLKEVGGAAALAPYKAIRPLLSTTRE